MKLRSLMLLLMLGACAPAPSSPVTQTNIRVQTARPVRLALRFDTARLKAFYTQCANCKVRYAKIEIKGTGHMSTPIYAQGADANGFTPIDENQGVTQISAQVPEGVNWVAYASLHNTNLPNQEAISRIGNAFHTDAAESQQSVELTLRSLQTAQIIESLHELNSPKILSPLELDKYQQLSDALLGVQQQPDGTYSFSRMPALDDPGRLLDAHTIASLLEQGSLSAERPEAAQQFPISQLLPEPKVVNSFRARSMTAGLSKLVMNQATGNLFSFDRTQGSQRVYSLQTPSFGTLTSPYNLGTQNAFGLRNRHLSLGPATGANGSVPALFGYEYTGLNLLTLKAQSQQTGETLWQYSFNNALPTDFVPVVQPDGRVYTVLSSTTPGDSGVYAVSNGQLSWSVPIVVNANNRQYSPSFANTGALSPDGRTLYVIRMSYPPFEPQARLYAIATDAGLEAGQRLRWSLDLGGESFVGAGPAIGSDGTVYLSTYQMPANYRLGQPIPGQLQAISAIGQRRWSQNLTSAAGFPPIIDHRDNQDIVYLCTDFGQVQSYSQSGQQRWSLTLKGTAGEGPVDSPLIGADLGNARTLYQALGNGLIYALRDHGSYAENLWAQAPGGKVKNGMVLRQGYLYAPTLDGGEGQFVQVKAIQVHSQDLPVNAPWPIHGGNLGASGIAQSSLQAP